MSRKFKTPAIASEPYWAEAPSRRISTRRSAMPGMADRSGPWAPWETPMRDQRMTAPRWRRLPLTSTSAWSGARPRRLTGRTTTPASPEVALMLNDGTALRSSMSSSVTPCRPRSPPGIASTGTIESVADRWRTRLPVTTISSSISGAPSAGCPVSTPGTATGGDLPCAWLCAQAGATPTIVRQAAAARLRAMCRVPAAGFAPRLPNLDIPPSESRPLPSCLHPNHSAFLQRRID